MIFHLELEPVFLVEKNRVFIDFLETAPFN